MATIPVPPCSLGVCYYPEQWDRAKWPDDLNAMRELGLRYVRIGEFAWSRLEPAPGEYQFGWLKEVLDLAGERGLSIVLGTPTATPPKWLVDWMPDMLAIDQDGRPKRFGSRRHYCFSHPGYRGVAARIVEKLAENFGRHPAIAAWQTDNEYGCHGTILSYSDAARISFRKWLQDKYQTVENLNRAWGNVFWSMEYQTFDEIELPNLTVTEPNPAHSLDFRRFSSDQVKSFNREQVEIIRRLSPGRTILHNFMGEFLAFDHFDVASDLDAASWDSYPLGALSLLDLPESHKRKFLRSGDPDFQLSITISIGPVAGDVGGSWNNSRVQLTGRLTIHLPILGWYGFGRMRPLRTERKSSATSAGAKPHSLRNRCITELIGRTAVLMSLPMKSAQRLRKYGPSLREMMPNRASRLSQQSEGPPEAKPLRSG